MDPEVLLPRIRLPGFIRFRASPKLPAEAAMPRQRYGQGRYNDPDPRDGEVKYPPAKALRFLRRDSSTNRTHRPQPDGKNAATSTRFLSLCID